MVQKQPGAGRVGRAGCGAGGTRTVGLHEALVLAKTGLLDCLEATTHHGAIDLLRQTAPRATVHADRRFVDSGRVVCSTGIAMSLHVVGLLLEEEVAGKTARQMEYPWAG